MLMNQQIDIDLFDKQIRTFGLDEIIKLSTQSIMIIGLKVV